MATSVLGWPQKSIGPLMSTAPTTDATDLYALLLARHGELMDAQALMELFKFGSTRSFRRNALKLPVSIFRVAGRRGWFARTRDVAQWLQSVGSSAHSMTLIKSASP